jgi:hypothetical protein
MKKIVLVLLFLAQISVYSQQENTKFTVKVGKEEGDLNDDGIKDQVIVTMDTASITVPLKLEILFGRRDKKFRTVFSSSNIIEPQYPSEEKGKNSEYQIPSFFIERRTLVMMSDIPGGHSQHIFKYKNENFELIKVLKVTKDDKFTVETEFNLLTGIQTTVTKALGSEKVVKEDKQTIKVKELPKLQDFKKYEKEFL